MPRHGAEAHPQARGGAGGGDKPSTGPSPKAHAGPKPKAGELANACWSEPGKVEALLQRNANPDDVRSDGWSAMCLAANKGHLDAIRSLLRHNASINKAETKFSSTPLYQACEHRHLDVVQLLVEEGRI